MAEAMERWNKEVIDTVPSERLLVWDPKEGWEPLCEFLEVPVPDTPLPHVNDTENFQKNLIMGPAIAAINAWWEENGPDEDPADKRPAGPAAASHEAGGVGFGRTGNHVAEGRARGLGCPTFHMIDLITGENRDRDLPYWIKIANNEPVDWDEVFEPWEATVDWPAASRWKEMVDHFSDLPVLLNYRDFDGWYKSCANTILAVKEAAIAGELPDDANRDGPSPDLSA